MRCWRPGSTSSSGRWTCAPPGCPAPCASCGSAPTSTCSRRRDSRLAPATRAPARPDSGRHHRPDRSRKDRKASRKGTAARRPATGRRPGPRPWRPGGTGGPGPPGNAGPDRPRRPRRQAGRTGPERGRAGQHHRAAGTRSAGDTPPGEVAGFGPLDPADARDLVAAAARHPDTRWCVTALHPDGTAAAHGCARGPHPWTPGTRRDRDSPGEPPGPLRPDQVAGFLRALKLTAQPRGPRPLRPRPGRDRLPAQPGPPHLVKVRNTRCTAPGCGQPAARCDLDHTLAWDQDGITCPCGLAPLAGTTIGVNRPKAGGWSNRTRCPEMADPIRTHLHHHPHRLPDLAAADDRWGHRGGCGTGPRRAPARTLALHRARGEAPVMAGPGDERAAAAEAAATCGRPTPTASR